MKKIISLLFSVLLLASCAQELVDNPTIQGPEVKVHFDFTTKPMTQIGTPSKATKSVVPSDINESGIVDMWILQFDASGNFIRKVYNPDPQNAAFDAPLSAGACTLYFLANYGPSLDSPDTESTFTSSKKVITSEDDLFLVSGGKKYIPMNAKLTGVTIPATGYPDKITVALTRLLAKVTFTYTANAQTNYNFDAVKLSNVGNFLYGNATSSTPNVTQTISTDAVIKDTETTLTFYLPENIKGVGNNATTNERLKGGIANATYIELTGREQGAQGGTPISFCIFLGANNYNDYNLTRNTSYAITATINGLSPSDQRVKRRELPNCYIVKPSGTVRVPVVKANQTNELGIQIPDVTDGSWYPEIVWQTETDLITVAAEGSTMSYFKVTAGTKKGNALVAVKNSAGTILWTWHIWVMDIDVEDPANQETMNNNVCMNLNLGAVAKATGTAANDNYIITGGLLYQWGRKDPFQGTNVISNANPTPYPLYNGAGAQYTPPSYTTSPISISGATKVASNDPYLYKAAVGTAPIGSWNQLEYSVRYPMLYLSNWTGSTSKGSADILDGADSWGGEYGQAKSPYDPCPAGWRVPSAKRFSTTATGYWLAAYTTSLSSTAANGNTGVFNSSYVYTATGRRQNDGTFISVGLYGYYWFATRYSATTAQISYLVPTTPSVLNTDSFFLGENIRCVKNWN